MVVLLAFSHFSYSAQSEQHDAQAQKITFVADDGFILSGHYFLGAPSAGGVLLLHHCDEEKHGYVALGISLSQQGMHALALDFRGFGGSTSADFSHEQLKAQSTDIVNYQANMAQLGSYWDKDTLSAYRYLVDKMDNKQEIAIVSIGCSTIQTVMLAERVSINSMVMISPVMAYSEKEQYKQLKDIPTFFISAAQNVSSYQTALELFSWNGDRSSVFKALKGNQFGDTLLSSTPDLHHDIVLWLKKNLAK